MYSPRNIQTIDEQETQRLMALRQKEQEQSHKKKIKNIKEGKEPMPKPIELFWHSPGVKELWETYDEWSQEP